MRFPVHISIRIKPSYQDLFDIMELGHQVVMFNRAGYGESVRLSEEPFHVNEFIVDLYETLTGLAADNPGAEFHLVGYSLGGYLLHEFARKHPALVLAVSYLDPMHSKELQISKAQRMGKYIC